MFPAFYSPEPLASLHKDSVSLAVLFSVGILLAASLAICAIYWQKKKKKTEEKSSKHWATIRWPNNIFITFKIKLNQIIYTIPLMYSIIFFSDMT